MKGKTIYDQRYAGEAFYRGKAPSSMAPRVLEVAKPGAARRHVDSR